MSSDESRDTRSYTKRLPPKSRKSFLRMIPRIPKRVLWAGAGVLLLSAAFLAWHFLVPPSTDEEILRDLSEDVLEAEIDRDYEELWDLIGEKRRERWIEAQVHAANLDAENPEEAEELARLEESSGISQAELREMDPEEWFVAIRKVEEEWAKRLPQELLREAWSDLEIGEITIEGDSAEVSLGRKLYKERTLNRELVFEKVDGEWCYRDIGFIYIRMIFKTIERKLATFLPRESMEPSAIDLLIEVGPEPETGEDLPLLHSWLKETIGDAGKETTVLIDAAPRVSIQRVLPVIDAVRFIDVWEVAFTRSAGDEREYRPGIRVNGVPIESATEDAPYTNPADHPATRRILTVEK